MKHSDFVCPDCGGSGKKIVYKEQYEVEYPCPCNHKTAIEKIDLDVPDGYEIYALTPSHVNIGNPKTKELSNIKLPNKIGDKWVCDTCNGTNRNLKATALDYDLYMQPCKNCKGLKAECIDIQVEGKLIITWREI